MAITLADRVKETSVTTGTGTMTLLGAVGGYQSFVVGVGDTKTPYYCIEHQTVDEWEVLEGDITDAALDTISRGTLISSSTGSRVDFSAGTKNVFCCIPASKLVYYDSDGNVGIGTDDPATELDVAGDVTVASSIYLPECTEAAATAGIIYRNGTPWIHDYTPTDSDGFNVFIGERAGNFTMNPTIAGTHCEGNVAIGYSCLEDLTTGYRNVALGSSAAPNLTTGYYNMAIGYAALNACTAGYENVAVGAVALFGVTTGDRNVGIGQEAGRSLTTGNYNVFIGNHSGYNASQLAGSQYSIAIGASAYTTKSYQCVLGYSGITETILRGNVLVDTETAPSGTATSVMMFADNAGDPTPGTNTAGVYAKDVSGTVEMFAVDEAGNTQQLSPHDPETGDWIYFGYNAKRKQYEKVNMERLVAAVEKLTGETFMEVFCE